MTLEIPVKRPNWVVRQLTPRDWAIFREVRLRALGEAPYAFGSTLEEAAARDPAQWQLMLGGRAAFVAVSESEPIGLAAGIVEHAPDAELISMWVDPAWRGQGVGGGLVRAVEDWAADQGMDRLLLWVADRNPRAERFYARLGFTRTGRVQPMPEPKSDRLEFEMAKNATGKSPLKGPAGK